MLEYAEGMVNDVKILLVVEIISNKKVHGTKKGECSVSNFFVSARTQKFEPHLLAPRIINRLVIVRLRFCLLVYVRPVSSSLVS